MEFVDLMMSVGFFAIPPLYFSVVRNLARSFIYSCVSLWLLMIVGAEYHLAYTPGYDSFAPGLAYFVGWMPAMIYSGGWLIIAWWISSKPIPPTLPDDFNNDGNIS